MNPDSRMSPEAGPTVAYLGDSALPGPASYLAGLLHRAETRFVHLRSDEPPGAGFWEAPLGLYVLSDYPASRLSGEDLRLLVERVRAGAGLLMLGGWKSYHGLGGDWDQTPLAELLPVEMLTEDDRRNAADPILVRAVADHPIVRGLPFDRPPLIGGYNAFRPRPGATVLLEGQRYRVRCEGPEAIFEPAERVPLLVVDDRGAGRRACLATDVAPHWIGPMVDWGDRRLTIRRDGDFIEVGEWYAEFFTQLVRWTLGEWTHG